MIMARYGFPIMANVGGSFDYESPIRSIFLGAAGTILMHIAISNLTFMSGSLV